MELLAIPLGWQKTPAKWLVMRRCAVLATATAFNLRYAEISLHRNYVVEILMYFLPTQDELVARALLECSCEFLGEKK